MSQAAITVGSKVRVTRVRDRIPADLVTALQSDATGTVKDFKVTDGKGKTLAYIESNGEVGDAQMNFVGKVRRARRRHARRTR